MRSRSGLAGVALVTVVLAGCSRTPPGGAIVYPIPFPTERVSGGTAGGPLTAAPTADASNPSGASGSTGPGTTGGTGAVALGRRVGTGPGGSTGEVPIASAPGVTATTIQVAYAGKMVNCSNSGDQSEASRDTWSQKYANEVKAYTDYVNKYIPLPGGRKLQLVGNDRTFGVPTVDDGGTYCPDKQRAAGNYIVSQLKPFATLGGDVGGDPVLARTVAAGKVVGVIDGWTDLGAMRSAYPYAWTWNGNYEDYMRWLADWTHKRIQGTMYTPSSGPAQPRVYGAMVWDDPEWDALANVTKQAFGQFGIDVKIYRIPNNNAQVAQNGGQLALRMKQDGVNSMIWGLPGGGYAAISMSTAFDGIAYNPDNLICFYGTGFFDSLFSARQWGRAIGVSFDDIVALRVDLTHYNGVPENVDALEKVWDASAQYDGQTAINGSAGADIWSNIMTFVIGLENSPVNFTAATFAKGMERSRDPNDRCVTEQFFGRDHPQFRSMSWGRDDPSGPGGYTDIYWVNKKSDFGTPGYYESYDGYNDYFGLNDLPPQPSSDTSSTAVPVFKALPKLGLSPFKSCSSIGLTGGLYG